ncbi:aldo/keto reductase [bacterium]|nr:aldo/keto reductase [bacterium]
MKTRREFISAAAIGAAATPLLAATAQAAPGQPSLQRRSENRFRPPTRFGLGGVAIGNAFSPTPTGQALDALDAAWDAGVRYFDTAPFDGFGLSERRFGVALGRYPRNEFVISTKVGRLLKPDDHAHHDLWKAVPRMSPQVDYTASGTRRSVEDSLQRLGLSRIDVVFIHDLSPDFFGNEWTEQFEIARTGAMPELTKMREEGLIKGWGLGVNRIEPILHTLEVADADIFLSATQYSLVHHEDALRRLFPKCEEAGVSIIVGAPLHAGFLAGRNRFNYGSEIPPEMEEKRTKLRRLAEEHGTDLRTAALQFAGAPSVVSVVIPGARSASQARENAASMKVDIPREFWEALKRDGLISRSAPVPT